jgi:nucleotide-binding universal stress UspA family protein
MFKHILIPTDGSAVAAKAVKAGVTFAKEIGARVTGYCAVDPGSYYVTYGEGYMINARFATELERRAVQIGRRRVAAIGKVAKAAGIPFRPLVTKASSPYEGIVAAAKLRGCDAIFMASNGRRGISRLIMGSVTNGVLTRSRIPVLVYR